MGIDIIVIIVLVICSAFFSATETAFTSANRIRLKNMANDGNRRAETALALIERYDELLSTILVGNNIANTANTAVATGVFVALYGHYGTVLSTVVMTLVVLVFGEVTPKTLAKEYPESVAMSTASLIHGLMILFTPVNWVFSSWKKLLLHAAKGSEHNITEDELITIVEEAETEGSIPSDHSELIQNAIEFDGIEAWDVLTPRVEIEAVDIEMSKQEIADLFLKTGFSRLPVYEDDLDRILGVLNQKDFHNYIYHSAGTVAEYIKPVVFCAGSMKAFALLQMMQHRKCQIAIVIDEALNSLFTVSLFDYEEPDIAYQFQSNLFQILLECLDGVDAGDYLNHSIAWFAHAFDLENGNNNYAMNLFRLIQAQFDDYHSDETHRPQSVYYPIYDYATKMYLDQYGTANMSPEAKRALVQQMLDRLLFDVPEEYEIDTEEFFRFAESYTVPGS